jgi:hypothetical protein
LDVESCLAVVLDIVNKWMFRQEVKASTGDDESRHNQSGIVQIQLQETQNAIKAADEHLTRVSAECERVCGGPWGSYEFAGVDRV